jgi:hypothetical protein
VVHGFVLNYVGDAARYLSPHPANVGSRQAIRASGIELVRRLTDSGDYDRSVLGGHSLGSVIGLDIIKHLWSEHNRSYANPYEWPRDCRQAALKSVEELGQALGQSPSQGDVRRFQKAQRRLWIEQRSLGNPWLITDFITMGSPLTHARLLLAKDLDHLLEQQRDREMLTCPPAAESPKSIYSYKAEHFEIDGQHRRVRVLHHGAAFACTSWTNIYFPVKAGVLGDLVGGPLKAELGPGVLDIALTRTPGQYLPLLPHTRYWRGTEPISESESIGIIKSVLDLDSRGWLPTPAAGGRG